MRVLIIHQYFNTPETGGPLRSYYLAEGLSRHGYEVEIITSHNDSAESSVAISGFMVHYLPVHYHNGLGFVRRIYAFAKFAKLALKKALTLQPADLCYAISTPLTIGWVALSLKARKCIPYIFEVGDLWPEAPIQMGVIRNPLVKRWLRKYEQKIYNNASQVVALSPGIEEGILKAAPRCRTTVIPNMSDCQFFKGPQSMPGLRESRLTNKFVILYCGTIGRANHLEYLVAAARAAQRLNSNLHFRIAGKGSELKRIKKMSAGLANIEFLDYLSKNQLREVMEGCDAVYVSYAAVRVLTTGSPNKFFDGLAGGKMMILNFGGWLKDLTQQEMLGIVVDPEQPETLVSALKPVVNDPTLLLKYQQNARRVGEDCFSREMTVQKILNVIENQDFIKGVAAYTLTA